MRNAVWTVLAGLRGRFALWRSLTSSVHRTELQFAQFQAHFIATLPRRLHSSEQLFNALMTRDVLDEF
jgi:hypothetical protein